SSYLVLRQDIGNKSGLTKDHVFIGNGSDEVLAFSFMAFFEPHKKILFPAITYSFYSVYATLFNIPYEEISLNRDFTLPIKPFFQSEGGVIFPNPNAPTSLYLPLKDRKSTRLNSSHVSISYAVFCLKK